MPVKVLQEAVLYRQLLCQQDIKYKLLKSRK